MNYYQHADEVKPPFTMGQMQEITHDDALWAQFLYQTQRYKNKWFLYGAVAGTVIVGILQFVWNLIT
jgi:hypothetical protein